MFVRFMNPGTGQHVTLYDTLDATVIVGISASSVFTFYNEFKSPVIRFVVPDSVVLSRIIQFSVPGVTPIGLAVIAPDSFK